MTTAAESHDAQLAAIKARHEGVRAKLSDPSVTEVRDITDFPMIHQVGFFSVYTDPIGRFWTVTLEGEPRKIVARMMFDPFSLSRPGGPYARDHDDTQTAQGFKAHEGIE